MNRRIFKYPLKPKGRCSVRMPVGARLLTVQWQGDQLCLWALVDASDEAPVETVQFQVVGTGGSIPDGWRWVATWQDPPFVWHLLYQAWK